MILVNTGKILYNTQYIITPNTIPKLNKLIEYQEATFGLPGIQQYKTFSRFFDNNIALYDRSNTIKFPFVLGDDKFSLPSSTTNKTFEECCDERSQQITKSAENFYFLYGGGIDSIVALHSLAKYTKNITILTTEDAINSNDYYYENIIGKYKIEHLYNFTKYDGVFVTAHLGDELFGTTFANSIFTKCEHLLFEKPTQENVLDVLRSNEYIAFDEETTLMYNIKLMMDISKKSPIELNTIHKFFWWLNFCLMWNVSYTRFMSFKESIPEETYFPFFATNSFQNWSIENIDNSFFDKKPAKDMLNKEYLTDLYKQNRNKKSFCCIPMAYVITDDYKNLFNEDSIMSINVDDDNSFVSGEQIC